jgi:hypothetical protein
MKCGICTLNFIDKEKECFEDCTTCIYWIRTDEDFEIMFDRKGDYKK